MICSMSFKYPVDLVSFCNRNNLSKEKIVQITQTTVKVGYGFSDDYTLFYED